MLKNNSLVKAVRLAIVYSAATATALTSASAFSVEDDDDVERIEVTGSRIQRTDTETPVPVTILTREDIEQTGAINVAEVLNRSPVSIAGSDQSNSSFTTSGVGLNTTALRNLGEERTLVLVNGRRFVSGVSPSSGYAVDLNAIPTAIIERIDILKSASSALYGSDAVAGVVNIITRDEFDGAELDVQFGQSDQEDREKKTINLTSGGSWDGGSAWFSLGYDDDAGIKATDREFSKNDLAVLLDDNGNEYIGPVYSSYPPQGRVNGYNADGTPFTNDGRFNRASYRQLVTPIERKYAAFGLKQELSDSVRLFTEVNWNNAKTNDSTIEPTPLNVNDDIWLRDRNGTGGMDINSPLIPELLRQNLIADGVTNLNETTFVRRMVELGARSTDVERSTIRVATGFDWDINDDWSNNTYLTWGQTDTHQENGGQINIERAANALDVIKDANGNLICASEHARLQGCVPLNLFGANTISEAAADYVRAEAKARGRVEQFILGSSVTGELPLELPGGNVAMSFGLEYREEKGAYSPGDLAQSGASSTNKSEATNGSIYTRDVFAELLIPVTDDLEMDFAVRYADHSLTGGDTTWNAGIEYSPVDTLKLRASAATAIRTPNIADLFGGRGETFRGVTDPCSGITPDNASEYDPNVYANCMAIPEIATRVAQEGIFSLTQAEAQGTGGTIGGNEDVQPETADTYSYGVIWQIVDGLSLTLDYYDISIQDAIATTSRTTVLNRCFTVDKNSFDATCGGNAVRDGNGALIEVHSGKSNENDLDVSGFDADITYTTEIAGGDFTAQLVYSYLDEYKQTSILSGDIEQYAGEITSPRNRANVNLTYSMDEWQVAWLTRYWGASVDSRNKDNFNFSNFEPLKESNEVGSVFYHDLNFRYTFSDVYETTFGVNNLFDREPPILPQGTNAGGTGINTASEAYDVTGRFFYAGVNVKF